MHLAPAVRGYGNYAGLGRVGLVAHFIVASMLAGYLSMNAKRIIKGEQPLPLWSDDVGETAKIWGASMAQGGGLGIYGDFLFGEANRNGQGFSFAALGGPAISDFEHVAQVLLETIHPTPNADGSSKLPGELGRIAAQNIPLVNTWYTRPALDYLIFWSLGNPNDLQRYEDRVHNEQHSGFISVGGHELSPMNAPRCLASN